MATKKLTEKQVTKAREIVFSGIGLATINEAVRAVIAEPSDAKVLKAGKKELDRASKILDKAIRVICPPPKEE